MYKQLRAAVTLLTAGAIPLALAANDVQLEISPAFAAHDINAVGYTDPTFRQRLDNLIGAANSAAISPVLPVILLIENQGVLPIVQATIRYPRRTTSGVTVEGMRTFNFGENDVTRYKTVALSPDGLLAEWFRDLANHRSIPTASLTRQAEQVANSLFHPLRFPSATVSLDSVVLKDGSVIGPDRHGILAIEKGKAESDRELISQLRNAALSESDISQWLSNVSKEARQQGLARDPKTGLPDAVKLHKANTADLIVKQIAAYGRFAAAQWLESVAADQQAHASRLHNVR
jgi:hypothetical protein